MALVLMYKQSAGSAGFHLARLLTVSASGAGFQPAFLLSAPAVRPSHNKTRSAPPPVSRFFVV
jgi:hypothetical protein